MATGHQVFPNQTSLKTVPMMKDRGEQLELVLRLVRVDPLLPDTGRKRWKPGTRFPQHHGVPEITSPIPSQKTGDS
jgi:hypothetical protein